MTDKELEKLRFKLVIPHLVQAGLDLSQLSDSASCPVCGSCTNIRRRRLNTNYYEEESNWMISCIECFNDIVAQYADIWSEYYAV